MSLMEKLYQEGFEWRKIGHIIFIQKLIDFFERNKIPYSPLKKKTEIGNFAFYGMKSLKSGEEYISKVGDADFINEPKRKYTFGAEAEQKLYSDAVNRGVKVRVMINSLFKKYPRVLSNAKALIRTGTEVRYHDLLLKLIFINKPGRRATACWNRFSAPKGKYIPGWPQRPGEMITFGWIIREGKSDFIRVFLDGVDMLIHELWEEARSCHPKIYEMDKRRLK
jgi:hypothetical protein